MLDIIMLHSLKGNIVEIKKVAIYDMDGTIVCSKHRYKTIVHDDGIERIDLQHWRDNQHLAMDDSLLPLHTQYLNDLFDSNTYVILATARVLNNPDMQFIDEVLGKPDYIISRKEGDSQSGGTLKIKGLVKFHNLKQFRNAEWIFYEDNTSYLKTVCDRFQIKGVYIPSSQGH